MTDFKLHWPTDYYRINQPFGANPGYYGKWGLPGHEGVDIAATYDSNIYACADGVVYQYFYSDTYGWNVRIDHENSYKTIYAHLHYGIVSVGDRVRAGQVIGKADSTGNSTGTHLHLTLKKNGATASGQTRYPGDIIDPIPYLVYAPAEVPLRLRVKASALNMRTGPSTAFSRIILLYYGQLVTSLESSSITRQKLQNGVTWVNVSYGGYSGWCYSQYLEEVK